MTHSLPHCYPEGDEPLTNIERVRLALAMADAGYKWEVESEYVEALLKAYDDLNGVAQGEMETTNAVDTGAGPIRHQGQWNPIATAPRDGTPILVFAPDVAFSPATGIDLIWYEPSIEAFTIDGDAPVRIEKVTHWMPLPFGPSLPSTQEKSPCSHAAIIGLDGTWHCQKCGAAIDLGVAHSSTDSRSKT